MSFGPLYVERMGWFLCRVERSFGVELLPPTGALTLGEYINFIAEERGTSPDAVIEIQRSPSRVEIQEKAFRRFQEAVEAIGGLPPASMDDPVDSKNWLPLPDPAGKWRQITEQLHCDFPLLLWPGTGFYVAFCIGFALMLPLWVMLLYALGFDKDPTTISDWITGGLFTLGMFVASALIPAIIAEWCSTRRNVPFESLPDLIDCIQQTANPPIEDSLCRPIRSSIRDYLQEIASEEFRIPPDEIGPEFSLIPVDLKTRWEQESANP